MTLEFQNFDDLYLLCQDGTCCDNAVGCEQLVDWDAWMIQKHLLTDFTNDWGEIQDLQDLSQLSTENDSVPGTKTELAGRLSGRVKQNTRDESDRDERYIRTGLNSQEFFRTQTRRRMTKSRCRMIRCGHVTEDERYILLCA